MSSDIIPTSGFDAARVNWGGDWRMPTAAESQALYNSTYWNWDNTDMGYYVYLPKNENDKGHFNGEQGFTPQGSYSKEEAILFFPGTCYGDGSSTLGTQEDGLYWLSTYWGIGEGNVKHAYYFNFHEASYILPQNNTIVMAGFPIRPVHD